MNMLNSLQQILNKWKHVHYSLMIIPNAGGSVKQVRIQALCVFAALFLVISAGLFFITSSLVLIKTNFAMLKVNSDITEKAIVQEDTIKKLSQANTELSKENQTLKNSTVASTENFNRRVAEVNKLKSQVDTLLALFNKDNHANINITTSRGNARAAVASSMPLIAEASSMDDFEEHDEIARQVQKNIDAYSALITKVEAEIKAQECTPDARPASGTITSPFGYRDDPFNRGIKPHEGIDINNVTGTPIKAAGAGVVTYCGYTNGYGNMIVISHGSGYQSTYAHLSSFEIKTGSTVKKGQVIGAMGSTGRSTGSHLHFEIRRDGILLDPEKVITSK